MTIIDGLGYLACTLVLATFCAKSMAALRAIAIASNVCFIIYALSAGLWPVLTLHLVMLPLNVRRLRETLGSPDTLIADGTGFEGPVLD